MNTDIVQPNEHKNIVFVYGINQFHGYALFSAGQTDYNFATAVKFLGSPFLYNPNIEVKLMKAM